MFDRISSGPINSVAAPAASTTSGIDTTNKNVYFSGPNGWVPVAPSVVAKVLLQAQTANVANVLTYTVPGNITGQFAVSSYEVAANTPTAATLPAVTATFTDSDTGNSTTVTIPSVGSVSAANVVAGGVVTVHPKAGTNVVIATTSYAAGSGTALSYNASVRLTYFG